MRTLKTMLIAFVTLVGCAHLPNSSNQLMDRVTPSVLPVYSVTGLVGPQTKVPAHKACSGVYVAPHLFVTTISLLELSMEGTISYDIGGIKLMNEGELSDIQDVVYSDMSTGLVVIRTEEVGTPMPLRPEGANPGETLTVEGYKFSSDPFRGRLAAAERVSLKGDVSVLKPSGFAEAELFNLELAPFRGLNGAAVLDARGRLAGIVYGSSGHRTAVISSRTLAAVLKGL